jgi:hypothetical protein
MTVWWLLLEERAKLRDEDIAGILNEIGIPATCIPTISDTSTD